jgi:prepilin-type processing-associated H-X9-DG protein
MRFIVAPCRLLDQPLRWWSYWSYGGAWWFPLIGTIYLHLRGPNSATPDDLRGIFCTQAAQQSPVNPCQRSIVDKHSFEHLSARSMHPGGVNCLFGDGHVEFYSDMVDLPLWKALSTIKGGGPPSTESLFLKC